MNSLLIEFLVETCLENGRSHIHIFVYPILNLLILKCSFFFPLASYRMSTSLYEIVYVDKFMIQALWILSVT